jgi:hypothetical protein
MAGKTRRTVAQQQPASRPPCHMTSVAGARRSRTRVLAMVWCGAAGALHMPRACLVGGPTITTR